MKDKFFYSCISILLPLTLINSITSLFSSSLNNLTSFSPLIFFFVSLVIGIVCAVVVEIFHLEKISKIGIIRAIIFLGFFVWLFCFLFNKAPFPQKIIPTFHQIIYIIIFGFQCFLTAFFREKFFERESILHQFSDLCNEELYQAMREHVNVDQDSKLSIHSLINMCWTFLGILCVIILGFRFFNKPIPQISYFWIILFTILSLIFNQLLTYISSEQYYASFGLSKIYKMFYSRIFLGTIFSLFCLIIGITVSSNNSVLQPSLIVSLLSKIPKIEAKQFSVQEEELPPIIFEQIEIPEDDDSDFFKGTSLPPIEPIFNFPKFFAILKYIYIGIGIIVLFYFLFNVFWKIEWKNYWKQKKILTYIKNFFNFLRDLIYSLFHREKKEKIVLTNSSKANEFSETVRQKLFKSKSAEKQKEIGKLTKEFMKIITYGETHNIKWINTMAPAEYTALLGNRFPEILESTKTVGSLFEQALYAKELLSKEEEKLFILNINTILDFHQKQDEQL